MQPKYIEDCEPGDILHIGSAHYRVRGIYDTADDEIVKIAFDSIDTKETRTTSFLCTHRKTMLFLV